MRLGILGDIHGYLPGSDRMCIDFAVHLTATLAVDAFLQVGDMCHYRSFARPVHWMYGNNDWPDVVRQVESGERPLRHIDVFLVHGCPAGLGYGREPDHGVPAMRAILDVVQPRVMRCGHAHMFREAHTATSTVYALNQLKDEYYILDTASWTLERFPSRSLA